MGRVKTGYDRAKEELSERVHHLTSYDVAVGFFPDEVIVVPSEKGEYLRKSEVLALFEDGKVDISRLCLSSDEYINKEEYRYDSQNALYFKNGS